MRHGRAKAARKTLQFFLRTVGLKSPYSILVDGNFIVHMYQQKLLPIVDRIDRVVQTSTTSASLHHTNDNTTNNNNHHTHQHQHHHHNNNNHNKRNRYYITQAAVDELQSIHDSLKKKGKEEKAAIFQQALDWVHSDCRILNIDTTTSASANANATEVVVDDNDIGGVGSDSNSEKLKKTKSNVGSNTKLNGEDGKNDESMNRNKNEDDNSPKSAILYHLKEQQQLSRTGGGDDPTNAKTTIHNNSSGVYIVATQDEELLNELRNWGTVPIVRLTNNNSVLVLEQPSKVGQRQQLGDEIKKWKRNLPQVEQDLVEFVKQQEMKARHSKTTSTTTTTIATLNGTTPSSLLSSSSTTTTTTTTTDQYQQQRWKRVKSKAKGPNPLSCKRKRDDSTGITISSSKKRRDRAAKKGSGES
jgi:rRNA-processing protein FCF1